MRQYFYLTEGANAGAFPDLIAKSSMVDGPFGIQCFGSKHDSWLSIGTVQQQDWLPEIISELKHVFHSGAVVSMLLRSWARQSGVWGERCQCRPASHSFQVPLLRPGSLHLLFQE